MLGIRRVTADGYGSHFGGPPLIADLLAGQLQVAVLPSDPALVPHFETGKLKALAVTSESRSPYLPGVATTAEAGFPQVAANYSIGLFSPAVTSKSIVDKLNAAVNDTLKSASAQASQRTFRSRSENRHPAGFCRPFRRRGEGIGGHDGRSRHQAGVRLRPTPRPSPGMRPSRPGWRETSRMPPRRHGWQARPRAPLHSLCNSAPRQ